MDLDYHFPYHLPDVQVTLTGPPGTLNCSSPCTQPSRQRCYCPICGRTLSQRRNLKQHLISTHKMTPDEAGAIVKRYNLELLMEEPNIQHLPQAPLSNLSTIPSPPIPLLPNLLPVSSP